MPKAYVIIPTYNEVENIEPLIERIQALHMPELYPVIVDDNSPDGTGELADKLALSLPQLKVIHRLQDRGRGSAGIEGFKFALREGAEYIIEMDADLSHRPEYIPDMLEAIKGADLVLGSRFVPGGKDIDRGPLRRLTTFLARKYIQLMLGVKAKDVTSGFRCFRRKVLLWIDLDKMISTGPSIVSEILYKAHLKGFRASEIPIIFDDRKKGETKLNLRILLKTLIMVWRFRRCYK